MNPAQLLNPKAFAKANGKVSTPKKRPASYGPRQSRKMATEPVASTTPSFNPAALLNPRAAKRTNAKADVTANEEADDANFGTSQMIERLHGITEREAAPLKKRKTVIDVDDDSTDTETKKARRSMNGKVVSSGVIGENLKATQRQADTIDLTEADDDDLQGDQDVEIIRDAGNEEVCLGMFPTNINVHRIPSFQISSFKGLGNDFWPKIKVAYQRAPAEDTVINLLDSANNKFGRLEAKAAKAMCQLLMGERINRTRFTIYLSSRKKKPGEVPGVQTSIIWPCNVLVYCPRKIKQTVGRWLSGYQLFLTSPPNPGKEYSNPHVPQIYGPSGINANKTSTSAAVIHRTMEEMRRDVSNMFDSLTTSDANMPQMEPPPEIITATLEPHQKQALCFMYQHETKVADDIGELDLWKSIVKKNGQRAWYHVITNQEATVLPEPSKSGILADDMGLGKTLSLLSLIAITRDEARLHHRKEIPQALHDSVDYNSRGTLIICPKSVMENWRIQISEHTATNSLMTYFYHGSTRNSDSRFLSKQDVIITTYNTVAAEHKDANRRRSPLAAINWYRIVLDEAHTIRNQASNMFSSCLALQAERRWAATGTPVQNSLDDLGALIKFLHIRPFDDLKTWSQYINAPLKHGDAEAMDRLKILVGSISLRRLKNVIKLGTRTEICVRLRPSVSEWALYQQFATKARTKIGVAVRNDDGRLKGSAYVHVLKAIGDLRHICAHGREMLSQEDLDGMHNDSKKDFVIYDLGSDPEAKTDDSFISSKQAYETFTSMQESEDNTCLVCRQTVEPQGNSSELVINLEAEDTADESSDENLQQTDEFAYLTPCYHLICTRCIEPHREQIAQDLTADFWYNCPECDQYVRAGFFTLLRSDFEKFEQARHPATRRITGAKWDEQSYSGPHTKVQELIRDLRQSQAESELLAEGEPPIRSVVFSGWTSYLDLIEYALDREGFGLLRLDGSMSLKARGKALEQFKEDNEKTVMLVSIKAGGQGLNLTAASKAYIMEPQFNPGIEQQAVDRIHRMGQTRDVVIKHYIMVGPTEDEHTVEEAILGLQKKKEALAEMVTDRKQYREEESKAKFQMAQGVIK